MSETATSVLSRFSLAGRKALVTGASRGIGRALATGLAGAGAAVAVSGRDAAALEGVIARILGVDEDRLPDFRQWSARWP